MSGIDILRYSNRAQSKLSLAKIEDEAVSAAQNGVTPTGAPESQAKSNARKFYMQASVDASQAVDLSPHFAKAYYRILTNL